MALLRVIIPMMTVTTVALVLALPWEMDGAYHFLLPMVAYTFIHAFAVTRTDSMANIFVFAIGVATDILKSGVLGYWALIYLTGHLVSRFAVSPGNSFATRVLGFVASAAAMALVAWAVASLYYLTIVDWWPIAIGFAGSAAVYPLTAFFVGARRQPRRFHDNLVQGS